MLAREYFIYHKQCHISTISICCMFCVLLQLVAGVYMVVDYAIVGP